MGLGEWGSVAVPSNVDDHGGGPGLCDSDLSAFMDGY